MKPYNERTYRIYIGTYASPKDPGIICATFDSNNGDIRIESTFGGIENPSFLALHPDESILYAVGETEHFEGQDGGAIYSFRIESNRQLRMVERQPVCGKAPCHITIDPLGRMLITTNYNGSSVSSFLTGRDGEIGEANFVMHEGSGPRSDRQEKPHPHSAHFHQDHPYVYVADLGIDQLVIYKPDFESNSLIPIKNITMPAGMGPRHFAFHPSLRVIYVIGELNSTVNVLSVSEDGLILEERQTIPTIPDDYVKENYCADIQVSPCGNFVLGSNRGHDSIVVYRIDQKSGLLSTIGQTSTGGRWPRHFAVSPDGHYVLVANQNSDNIVAFSLDLQTGELVNKGEFHSIPKPVCIVFE